MKAVLVRKYGGPEVLELADVPEPHAGPDQVVVRVAATSVNPVDWMVRDGAAKRFVRNKLPTILGCDLAGVVDEVGANVRRVKVGDEVFAMMPQDWGAHAERVVLAEHLVVKKPARLSMIEAASLPTVAMTALNALSQGGGVQPGESVLVNGASSSVGMCAVQIAKARGATVTAVCGRDSFELVKRLGADALIDYRTTEFASIDQTFDLVIDCVGNHPWTDCKRLLRGRKAFATTVPHLATFLRQFMNPFLGIKVYALLTTGNGEALESIAALVETKQLVPVIDKVFPMREVAAAQEYSKSKRAKGKIVLDVTA